MQYEDKPLFFLKKNLFKRKKLSKSYFKHILKLKLCNQNNTNGIMNLFLKVPKLFKTTEEVISMFQARSSMVWFIKQVKTG